NFTVNYKDNLYNQAFLQKRQHISSLAYMDDTQWISDNQSKLEQMLKIADYYYTFADIKVNKDKSELLLKKPNKDFAYEIYNFTSEIIVSIFVPNILKNRLVF